MKKLQLYVKKNGAAKQSLISNFGMINKYVSVNSDRTRRQISALQNCIDSLFKNVPKIGTGCIFSTNAKL